MKTLGGSHSPSAAASEAAPYAGLTPDAVLDAMEDAGFACNRSLLALNSYENRVYQVGLDEGPPVIAKFYRPHRWSDAQILEEHAFVAELHEREIPVVPALTFDGNKTLHDYKGFRFSVFPRHGGRAPNLDDKEVLEWLGRFLGRIHAVGALKPFAERPALNLQTFGVDSRDWLLEHALIPAELRAAWSSVAGHALDDVARAYERAGSINTIRLHGDCHIGNVLWRDGMIAKTGNSGGNGSRNNSNEVGGPHFVYFDDARNGPAVQDLWMLFPSDKTERKPLVQAILRGYEDFHEFDDRELQLIEALRTLRLLHYSAWIARRWNDPAFPAAFPWFGTAHYWQDRILELKEQIAVMEDL